MSLARISLLISIMSRLANTNTTFPRREYAPYRSTLLGEAARLLEAVQVRNVTAIYYECKPQYTMPPRRIGDDMFYYIVQGSGEVVIEEHGYKVAAGDCAHFSRGVLHAAYTEPKDPFHVVAIHYDATVYGSLTLPQLLRFPEVTRVGLQTPFHEMSLIACREYSQRPPGWERGLEALAMRLLLHFIREHMTGDDTLQAARWREVRRILPALEMMRQNLNRVVTTRELATTCHLSEPQFRRVFSRAMNATPNEYLRRLRLQAAANLLRSTDDTIDAIAARVGYSDPSFFAHSFKALMGTSPGKYRTLSSV